MRVSGTTLAWKIIFVLCPHQSPNGHSFPGQYRSVKHLPGTKKKDPKLKVKRLTKVTKSIAMSSPARIVHVTHACVAFHSCDLEHRTEFLIYGQQSVRLLRNCCQEGRMVIYPANFQRQRVHLNPGRLESLPQYLVWRTPHDSFK